jgi:hypothetical protein
VAHLPTKPHEEYDSLIGTAKLNGLNPESYLRNESAENQVVTA